MCELIFNLNKGTLGKYQVGSFAPKDLNNQHLFNYNEGYSVAVYEKEISAILVCFRKGYRGFNVFGGEVYVNEKKQKFDVNTSIDEIISIFGQPVNKWNDGVEQGLEYSINEMDLEIIWHVDGEVTLEYISMEI